MRSQPSFRIKEKFTTWSPDVLVVVFVVASNVVLLSSSSSLLLHSSQLGQDLGVQDFTSFFALNALKIK